MKILVLSDSHSYSLNSIDTRKYDAIIHCGDYGKSLTFLKNTKAYYVKGNCDFEGEKDLSCFLFGKKIYITHGHYENVKYGVERLIYRALEQEAEICFFGHTHQQTLFFEENILFLNPGSFPTNYAVITDDKIELFTGKTKKEISYRW